MNRTPVIDVSLHHRHEHLEHVGMNGHTEQDAHRKGDVGDHQDPAQRYGVLIHPLGIPGAGWPLTDALANARSARG